MYQGWEVSQAPSFGLVDARDQSELNAATTPMPPQREGRKEEGQEQNISSLLLCRCQDDPTQQVVILRKSSAARSSCSLIIPDNDTDNSHWWGRAHLVLVHTRYIRLWTEQCERNLIGNFQGHRSRESIRSRHGERLLIAWMTLIIDCSRWEKESYSSFPLQCLLELTESMSGLLFVSSVWRREKSNDHIYKWTDTHAHVQEQN